MAWDAARPVPWRRLLKEGSVFLALGLIGFALFVKNTRAGSYIGLVIGMAIYVGFSAVLAKFGYTRQSMKEARQTQMARSKERSERKGSSKAGATRATSRPVRPRPPPTRRTSTGPSQRPNRKRR